RLAHRHHGSRTRALAHGFLDYCTEATSQFLRLMGATGAHMLSNGDSAAGPSVVSPRIYRRFALPYEQRMAALSHSLGVPYALHVCGNTKAILADLVTTGADAIGRPKRTFDRGEVLREKFVGGAVREARCIDTARLSAVGGAPVRAAQKGNRPECACFEARDIGEYDTCPHGCVYCYAVRNR